MNRAVDRGCRCRTFAFSSRLLAVVFGYSFADVIVAQSLGS